jgi:hypothetical protein
MSPLVVTGTIAFTLAFIGAVVSQRDIVSRQKQGETLASPGTRRSAIIFAACIVVQIGAFALAWIAN